MIIKSRDVITARPMSIGDSATVSEALMQMADTGSRMLIVESPLDGVSGVVTHRDMMKNVLNAGLNPEHTSVRGSVWKPLAYRNLTTSPYTPQYPTPAATASRHWRKVFRIVDTEDA
jgi:signal-transduction protein with cAMP-binding, CBS, and nucleotidyltransferase domain